MNRVFKPAARAAGIPELTFHDLRYTGASLMIAAGCNVKVIAEQMGHADGGTLVLRRYGHLYKGAHRQAAIALESHVLFCCGDDMGWRPERSGRPNDKIPANKLWAVSVHPPLVGLVRGEGMVRCLLVVGRNRCVGVEDVVLLSFL